MCSSNLIQELIVFFYTGAHIACRDYLIMMSSLQLTQRPKPHDAFLKTSSTKVANCSILFVSGPNVTWSYHRLLGQENVAPCLRGSLVTTAPTPVFACLTERTGTPIHAMSWRHVPKPTEVLRG